MDHRERFLQLKEFLKPYQKIWQNEIMLQYPDPIKDYNPEWILELNRFKSKEEIISLEKKDVWGLLKNPQLLDFYTKIRELCEVPLLDEFPKIPEDRFTWLFMIPKKQHEIKRLAPHIDSLYRSHGIKEVVDIGGGIGLLAQTLNNYYGHRVSSIDMNGDFQSTGKKRHEKNAKDSANMVVYRHLRAEAEGAFRDLLGEKVMPVGLHTCGRLALDIIRVGAQKRVPVMVNFGCCYHTLDESDGLQNISDFAQKNEPLRMNKFALTLSCRAHRKMDEKDYDLKLKVKLYRYAFHILIHDYYGITRMVTLGNSHPSLYNKSFAEYALEQLERISLNPRHTFQEFNEFFNNIKLQGLLNKMMTAGLIRNALGRPLELYLLLDRAIYLEEQGYRVRLQEFFNEEISPRNLGLTAEIIS